MQPPLDGTLSVAGLDEVVEIIRDSSGIPHVRAGSASGAFFGQGFACAQDRLWQMEYDRRRADGRLAELLGPRALTMDIFVRRLGISASARRDHESFDDATRTMVEAYAAGVNAFIDSGAPAPREFELLDIDAPPWEPWHCGAVLKVRHVLMGTFDSKLWRARLVAALGPRGAVVPGSADGRTDLLVVPVGAEETWAADEGELEPSALATAAVAEHSNSWAVHGSRTVTGRPLLAGDPHRRLEQPNVYYQNHISCPDFDVIGLSMPGVPGMFHFGHNADVAWCVTHAYGDGQDLWVERFDGDGRYEFRGELRDVEHRREVVRVRDSADVEIDVMSTHHGPVVFGDPFTPGDRAHGASPTIDPDGSPVRYSPGPPAGTAITMRWTATGERNASLPVTRAMLEATSVDELDETMRGWVDPCNNFLMADVHGTIGYVHRGRVPLRSRANAWTPVPGWTGEHEWDGDVPFEELPRLRNPSQGVIVTANNRVVGRDYPHYLGLDYSQSGRARRVLERLQALENATVQDMAAIHGDVVSLPSRAIAVAIARNAPAEIAALVDGWDGSMDADAVAPTIYATVRNELAGVLIEREPLSRAVPNPYVEEPYPTPPQTRARTAMPRIIGRELLNEADWDDATREAIDRATARLRETLGADPASWTWGRVHRTGIVHPLSRDLPDAASELNPPSVSMGGDGDCVLAGSAEVGVWVEHSSVARYVFDLSDWDNSSWIVPVGSSGHPGSAHHADQVEDWAALRLRPMTYSWDRVEADAETRQVLEPSR